MEEFESLRITFRLDAEQEVTEQGDRIGINTRDLMDLTRVVEGVSVQAAERAALEFVGGLELSPQETAAALDAVVRARLERYPYSRRSLGDFAPGQVTELAQGSVVITVLLAANLVVPWAIENLFGEAIVEGWKESVGRERLKAAARNIFGGAAEAATEEAQSSSSRNIRFDSASIGPAGEAGTATQVSITYAKHENSDVEVWRERGSLWEEGGWRLADEQSVPGWEITEQGETAGEEAPREIDSGPAEPGEREMEA